MQELLFVYGTLKNPEIQQEIIGKNPIMELDILENHTIVQYAFSDGIYPIAVEAMDKNIEGFILFVSLLDFIVLDEYEGSGYKRVKILLKSRREAWIYMKN
ncbi:MAG: gamma-glutamylcyclotransferase [Candidatus Gracilibacteria bacterium]|nr:gamma-glutamylcyclotransferase [Candidatus Gracilibacteria bacterium]